jgi:hypothetical protein
MTDEPMALTAVISKMEIKPGEVLLVRVTPEVLGMRLTAQQMHEFGTHLSRVFEEAGITNPVICVPYVQVDIVSEADAELAVALAAS